MRERSALDLAQIFNLKGYNNTFIGILISNIMTKYNNVSSEVALKNMI